MLNQYQGALASNCRTGVGWLVPSPPLKGAPAQESCTGSQLVSPTPGCEKKDTSGTKPQNAKLSTLEILLASTDAMVSGTTIGNPLKPESECKKKNMYL